MLDQLVVVDYIDGAGGEYLSNIINSHAEFNCASSPLATNMQAVPDVTQKWFNSRQRISNKWDAEFTHECKLFLDRCHEQNITAISIPYHLYYYPAHINALKSLSRKTQFVKINSDNYQDIVMMDFVRKILFRQITARHLHELKYRIKDRLDEAQPLLDLFKSNKLFGIDFVLFAHSIKVNKQNRSDMLNNLLKKERVCPSTDIEIDYGDFFVLFDKLKKSYYTLCNGLNIVPSEAIAEEMLIRNKRNLEEVTEFSKNFESIKNTILSTTL